MGRPRVILNMAMTADGRTASAAREYPRFTSAIDRARMQELRARADAVLVGAETVRAIDPPLAVRDPTCRMERAERHQPPGLFQVVLSASGRVAPTCKALAEPDATARILATTATAALGPDTAWPGIEVWRLGQSRVDLSLLLARLGERGVERLLVEGGAETNGSFLTAGLVDELYLTIAPTLLGGRGAPSVIAGDGLSMATRAELVLEDLDRDGDELFCHYRVVRAVRPEEVAR